MNILNNLTKSTTKSQKRVGRGYGSGKGGHTTGRGAKGDKIRGKTKLTFDGTKIKKSWIKRLPFLRGKHRVLAHKGIAAVSLDQLAVWFKKGETIDLVAITKATRLPRFTNGIKVLSGRQPLVLPLTLKGILISQSAKDKLIAAGGKIEV